MALSAEAAASKQVPALVTMLIDKCATLFGAETVSLFADRSAICISLVLLLLDCFLCSSPLLSSSFLSVCLSVCLSDFFVSLHSFV